MARTNYFFILTLVMAIAQQIHAGCGCNKKGEDACARSSGIIIPKPKHHKRPVLDRTPIRGNCRCSKSMIEPASFLKPSPSFKKPPPSCRCQAPSYHTTYLVPQYNYLTTAVRDYTLPADPVSVSLAQQAVKAFKVPEAKLAYGFVRKPINSIPDVYISPIKEENLYALANDVITLKKPRIMENLEEEYYAELEEDVPAAEYNNAPPTISYGQLGYETEQYEYPKFIPMTVPNENYSPGEEVYANCGWNSGNNANIQNFRKYDSIIC